MTPLTPAPLSEAEQAAYVEIYAIAHNSELLLPQMGEGATCGGCQSMARAVVAAIRPLIIAEALGDHEAEHIVEFEETTFSVQHPLSERLNGSLFDCQLHADITALPGPPVPPGRYRAVAIGAYGGGEGFRFEPVDPALSRPTSEEH